jgi:hypothetical protein
LTLPELGRAGKWLLVAIVPFALVFIEARDGWWPQKVVCTVARNVLGVA